MILLLSFINLGCTIEKPPIRPKKNLSKDQPVYYNFIAHKYYILKEYEKAIFQYQKILKKFANQPVEYNKELAWAEYEIGFCYYQLGDNKKAIEYFERVINYYDQASARILAQKMLTKVQNK